MVYYYVLQIRHILRVLSTFMRRCFRTREELLCREGWKRLKLAGQRQRIKGIFSAEWWIGGLMPLNPYIKGQLVFYLLDVLKPKQLQLPPDELVGPIRQYLLERSLYRNWLQTSKWDKGLSRTYAEVLTVILKYRRTECDTMR